MGRSTKQKQQSQSSSLKKRPKDYLKQNQLRNKSVKQELLSSTRQRSTKLNAVMQMDPPGSRRRLARNPIAEQQQQDSSPSLTDADSSNDAAPGGSNSAECRRSSRKKTIKFDVRDLLNKNRKSHKIQIEARIDSNAPKVGAGQVSKAELDSKQKNFIEKSAIFRRYSISENKLPPRPPPPPGALIHTIQQCVGELEQLPLDGGELNMAAISPIARRLSRTQDILTASMIKPKQVSSLIVTKLESASTSKAAVVAASSSATATAAASPVRRRVVGGCQPSTSTAIQQQQSPPKRGRKPKAKVFIESTAESSSSSLSSSSPSSSSSSNDSFDQTTNKQKFRKSEKVIDLDERKLSVPPDEENSTTGIDLKENLDASAVTLPQPTILDDCMMHNNSTDGSFVAADHDDLFTERNHSSDESTIGSMTNSPKSRKTADEISLFGRSNSTETSSSDDSEKRRRKIRISVKRVSLTPQKSPKASSSSERKADTIDLLSSTNDETSNEDQTLMNERKSKTKLLKGNRIQVETCSTPPLISLDGDTSNATSIGSSVIEITSWSNTGTTSAIVEDSLLPSTPTTRRVRSCKLNEENSAKSSSSLTQDINLKPFQKSTVPAATATAPAENVEVLSRNRSSSRKSVAASHLPIIETIAASSPSTSLKNAQSMENEIIVTQKDDDVNKDFSLIQKEKSSPPKLVKETEEIIQQEKTQDSDQAVAPQIRNLRSAQSVQAAKPPTSASKRQRKSNKVQLPEDTPTESNTHSQAEEVSSDKEISLILSSKNDQHGSTFSIRSQDLSLSNADAEQSLPHDKDVDETDTKLTSESDKKEPTVVSSKQTRSRSGLKKHEKEKLENVTKGSPLATEETVEAIQSTDKKKSREPAAGEDDMAKSVRESTTTVESTDRSSTDTTTNSDRRESPRLRSSSLPTKKQQTTKKIFKVIAANSSTPDSSSESSESHEKSLKNRKQMDDKAKEETSSLCSESSSITSSSTSKSKTSSTSSSSSSSSSSSASTAASASSSKSNSSSSSSTSPASSSSSSSSSASSSSSSSEGRSTRSSKSTQQITPDQHQQPEPQLEGIEKKSPIKPSDIIKTQSSTTKSDSECSENFSKSSEKTKEEDKFNDIRYKELEKLMERRKTARLEHWSTRQGSESSDDIQQQHTSKTRSGRSRGRVEKKHEALKGGSESSDDMQHRSKTRSGRSRVRALGKKDEEIRTKSPDKPPLEPSDEVQVDKINIETTENASITETTNTAETTIPSPNRSKSKKRTRRFVPIKYSSSESGSLSDDGNTPSNQSNRLTRTRRKTISSASELEEFTSAKLSPPDLALEYLPRKSKQGSPKTLEEELTMKNDENDLKNEENTTQEAKSKFIRSRRAARSASRGRPRTTKEINDESTNISKESESIDQSSKNTETKQQQQQQEEAQQFSEPTSPSPSISSSDSSTAETQVKVLRQRKVTRLSLKTQVDSGNSQDLDSPPGIENQCMPTLHSCAIEKLQDQSSNDKKSHLECDLKDDNTKKPIIPALKEAIPSISDENCLPNKDSTNTDVLDSEVYKSKSPKQRKGIKSTAKNTSNKEDSREKIAQAPEEIIVKLNEEQALETQSTERESAKEVLDEAAPYLRKITRSSPRSSDVVAEIKTADLAAENSEEKKKQEDQVQEEKNETLKLQMEIAKASSGTRKGTRLSMKKLETINSEKTMKEAPEKDDDNKTAEPDSEKPQVSIPVDIVKSDQTVKTPRQRKPTRFTTKTPEEQLEELEPSQPTKDPPPPPTIVKNDEAENEQKESDLSSSPKIRKTKRLSPRSLNLKDIEDAPQEKEEEFLQPIEQSKVDETTPPTAENSTQLKLNDKTAIDDYALIDNILEKPLTSETVNNCIVDALKLVEESPRRKRKPTRFSPKSPDKLQSEAASSVSDDKTEAPPSVQLNEGKQIVELLASAAIVAPEPPLVKTPKTRKATRFSPKVAKCPVIQEDIKKTEESQSSPLTTVENKQECSIESEKSNEVSTLSLEASQVKEPVTRGRKATTRTPAISVDNLQIEKELKKVLDGCSQSAINVVETENFEASSSLSSLVPTQQQEPIKATRAKKGTRFSPKVADSSLTENITKLELLEIQTKAVESEDKPNDQPRVTRKTQRKIADVVKDADVLTTPTTTSELSSSLIGKEKPQEVNSSINSSSNEQLIPQQQEESNKYLEETNKELTSTSAASSPSIPKLQPPDHGTKRGGFKKQLQSMLDSLTSKGGKVTPQKETTTTPRRKKKTLGQDQQEATTPAAENSTITKKTADEPPNQDQSGADMKIIPSSDSNQSDDSIKPQEATTTTTKIDQKQTPRRQLDSSFIESLEKSLLRPTSTKKSSKKKEKDKLETTTIVVSSPKTKEESSSKKSTPPVIITAAAKKSLEPYEELKNSETSSPKVKQQKNKQPKESPKVDKKHSSIEQQIPLSKRKALEKAAAKELEQMKLMDPETSFSEMFKDDPIPITSASESFESSVVVSYPTPKTKAETKFFSPDKPSSLIIEHEPSSPPPIAIVEKKPVSPVKEKSPDLIPDPLKDIEKFIEDGVNLLKRCYKIDADDDASLDRDILKPDPMMTPKKCKLDEESVSPEIGEQKPPNTPPDDENSNSNSECSTMTTNTSTSEIDTPNGIRRSHRIKNNSKSTKCLVGRGLVRERERFSTKDDEKTIYSIDDQKMDLAEVEAKNSQFLKDMEERLSNFRVIRENEYKCERVISKEAKRMLCDCFLTQEEEVRGELGCGEDCLNRLLMIECGSDCTVRERCTNRRFNKFLYSPCRVFRTEKKGFGIMADIEILPGEFIMEYVGEVINGDEFEFRINEYSKDKNKHYYFMALRSDAVIDATGKGNISRFINHSCDPNAETQKWTVNGELRIGFFSRKSIMPGEEITFDYQYQRYGKEAQRCYCESSNCRGWIGAEPSSEEEEYEGVDEEDESEETEEEEVPEPAVVSVPVIPSPIIPAVIAVADVEIQPLVPVVAISEVPAIEAAEVVPLPQPVATPTPIIAEPAVAPTVPMPDLEKEVLPKKKKEKKRLLLEEKIKRREPKQFLEDPDIEDEVRFLVKCGLRNQADTLRLSRLIVRAKLLETRIKLLQILGQGELPCRRLFLDYHGLRLLHGWMSEVIDTRDPEKSMEIRMELLTVLECLPISNKTMLTDSKVYQTVRDWSNNKESHSPSDESPKDANANSSSASTSPLAAPPPPTTEDASSELQKLAAKLVHTWDNLPEVFRIPKRERIERMKEHEREADRQYKDVGRGLMTGADRNKNRERFISKSGQKGRFKWSKEKEQRERAIERRKFAQNNSSGGKDVTDKSTGSLAGESHLSKEQRRELFAAKVARDEAEKRQAEERREFDIKCRFFGLDPKRVRPENMPFCVNPSTGQWYSTDKKPIATPPSYAHVQVPVKPKSTNPEDYRLPEMDLPPLWKFAISPKGKIYYYHVKIRIPQWEPPIKILPLAGQHTTAEVKNSESDSSNAGIIDSSEDDIEVIKGLDPIKLQAYIEKKIEDRRLQRYNRLVGEKPISPRKEEDRIYNQMEVRKYKENKEKIRKRKEEIRRRRDIIGMPQATIDSSSTLSEIIEAEENAAAAAAGEALPIQDYLLSSEEEELMKAECNNSPLIDKIVQGDKIVDELDALHRKRSLKRSLPIRDKYEHKKRKLEKNKDSSKSTKRNKDGEGGSSSSSKYRKVREKFRCEIAGIIVPHLKPYRSETCITGRILTDDDFNHLARKLTHFVMVKELKYCESIGQTLIVTESVKNKSREFIKKYMAKYGKVYVRPKNDPEFKDIPFL